MEQLTASGTVESAYGQSIPKDKQAYSFTYRVFATVDEAAAAGFNFLELANASEKSNKKSSAYQAHIKPYAPDPNSPEALQAGMVKNYMKLNPGVSEEQATKIIAGLMSAKV